MADLIKLTCNVDAALAQVKTVQEDQLPFIIAKSLTTVAQAAQKAVRARERGIFQIRNDWTTRNTKITPATKTKFVAEVYTDTSNAKTGAPDYLVRQEEGGERVPVGGHKFLAIPTRYLWKYTPKSRPLPDGFRPSALLPAGAALGIHYGGSFNFSGRGSGAKRAISGRSFKKLGNGDFVAFLQQTKGGTLCIFVRHGGVGYKAGTQDAEPWFTLVRSAHIPPRLQMQQTVEQVVNDQFEAIFVEVARDVGISVRL